MLSIRNTYLRAGLIRECIPTPLVKVDGVWVVKPTVYEKPNASR